MRTLSRREFLTATAAAAGIGAVASSPTAAAAASLLDALPAGQGQLRDLQHLIFFVQENRSFDNVFGTYKGTRGFDDRSVPGGAAAFRQSFPASPKTAGVPDPLLPWHLDTTLTVPPRQGQCSNDIEHQWAGQHDTWHGGKVDNWMPSHLLTEPDALQAAVTMSYFTRADLPFTYALADAFTICDSYFCSVIAGTDVNRLYSMTGTIDPDGWDGGLQFLSTKIGTVNSPGADMGTAGRWIPYPQVLERAGISWKCYGTADGQLGDNTLRYFPQYRPITGNATLAGPAFSSNAFPADFAADCLSGALPQVSFLFASAVDTQHAPAPMEWGESILHDVLLALSSSGAWSTSAMFLTYDENGGFFDHVPPPTPPPGTPGEYLSQARLSATARKEATTVDGRDLSSGPIGLGFRVPMLVISPFTRNPAPSGPPLVCSDVLDHTSMLRFVETWSRAVGRPAPIPDRNPSTRTPGLSAWRRAVVGDLTGAFNFAVPPDASSPSAVLAIVPNRADPKVLAECTITGTAGSEATQTSPIVANPVLPAAITQPRQEPLVGAVRRPSGLPAAPAPAPTPAPPPAPTPTPAGATLPRTGGDPAPGLGTALAAAGIAALVAARRHRRNELLAPPTTGDQPPA
ncbi:MAG TPA: alkaline phosphatase family protein [Acidimicrobiales bacterium]